MISTILTSFVFVFFASIFNDLRVLEKI